MWDGDARTNRAAVDDPLRVPRARGGRAPDVFRVGAWTPMREYRDEDEVDFAIVGTGAGGGTLACRLAEAGFSVVALDAGPFWRPLEDFASDEMEQTKLYWTDERLVDGENPLQLGSNNSGKSVGGIDRSLCDGVASLSPGMVQIADASRLRRRLAARLARDVGLLRRGRAGAQDRGSGKLSMGSEAAALSLPGARAQCGRGDAWPAARRRSELRGRQRQSPRFRPRAELHRPASIAAFARSAAPPTQSRARF